MGGPLSAASTDCGSASPRSDFEMQRTTLVLKNLPFICPNTTLVELLDSHGLHGLYDLLYVPTNFRTWQSYGYAFVNWVSQDSAVEAMLRLDGYTGWTTAERGALEIDWCDAAQGLEVHLQRFRDSPVMHPSVPDGYKPMFFRNGVRQHFPRPTKPIRAPRCKHGNRFTVRE